ncbi:MAG: hypothetical protein SVR94_02180 [Pseudomonadota bacterium]|nr:hypothetical protein [Pseudomonadota bacterium]
MNNPILRQNKYQIKHSDFDDNPNSPICWKHTDDFIDPIINHLNKEMNSFSSHSDMYVTSELLYNVKYLQLGKSFGKIILFIGEHQWELM